MLRKSCFFQNLGLSIRIKTKSTTILKEMRFLYLSFSNEWFLVGLDALTKNWFRQCDTWWSIYASNKHFFSCPYRHSHIWWKRVLQPSVLHLLPDSQPLSCGNSNRICLWRPHRWWSAFTSYPRNSFLYILWLERCH